MNSSFISHQRTLLRPALSADNQFLAAISPASTLQIINLHAGCAVGDFQLPKASRSFLSEACVLRWAPDLNTVVNDHDTLRAWILIASDSRIVVIEVDLPAQGSLRVPTSSTPITILADYQFEPQYGKIIVVNFVINHHQALVTFEMNTHATLIHFTKRQKDDIPYTKFSNQQGFVQTINHKHFALLLREKGQDSVAVFSSKDGNTQNMAVFAASTSDAQGLTWSPTNDPVLAVWDSASYGPCVRFFTALGHPLKILDMQPQDSIFANSLGVPGIGLTCLRWVLSPHRGTLMIAAMGNQQLLLRSQSIGSACVVPALQSTSNVMVLAAHLHRSVLDGSKSKIWQESSNGVFEALNAMFEAQLDTSSEIDLIEVNCNAEMIATKLDRLPNCVWVWDCVHEYPVAVVMLQHNIRTVRWHPFLPNLMVITTNEQSPRFHVYHQVSCCPAQITIPLADQISTSRWTVEWIMTGKASRCPLLIQSNKQYDIGLLGLINDEIAFESILQGFNSAGKSPDESTIIDTPSKTSKAAVSTGWNLGETPMWNADANERKWQVAW